MFNALKHAGTQWFSAVLLENEPHCFVCQSGQGPVCPVCNAEYVRPDWGRCLGCGKLIDQACLRCTDCQAGKGPRHLQQITALGYYHGAWQTLIQEAKFHGQPFLLERMGLVLADWAMRALPAPDVVIPVPMHEERLLERGFNQAEVLASMIHWRLGLRWQDTLERVLPTTPQVRLSRQERLHNLQGAFRCTGRRREYDTRVWLVDDVTTTGATLNECAKVLRESGYQEIFAVCLAAGLEKSSCTVAKMRI